MWGSFTAIQMLMRLRQVAALVKNATTSVTLEGAAITLIHGYPTADAAGIIAASNLNAANDDVTISAGGAAAGSNITVQVNGATTPASCQISYTAPTAAATAPAISVVTSGC